MPGPNVTVKSWVVCSCVKLKMNYAKAEMWKAEKSGLNHVKQNSVKQISGFAVLLNSLPNIIFVSKW